MRTGWLTCGLDAAQEERFRRAHLARDIVLGRWCLLLTLVPVLGFALTDYLLSDPLPQFLLLGSVRLLLGAYSLLLWHILPRIPDYRVYDRRLLVWGSTVAACFLAAATLRPQTFVAHIVVALLAAFVFTLALPMRFANQVVLAVVFSVGEMVIVLAGHSMALPIGMTTVLTLAVAVAIAIACGWQWQCGRRREFLAREEEAHTRAALEAQVTEHARMAEALRESEARYARLLTEAEQHSAELDAVLESMVDGLTIVDSHGKIVRMNASAERIFATPAADMHASVPERIRDFAFTSADGEPITVEEAPTYRVLHGETVQGMIQVIHPPTGTIWLSVNAAPIRMADGRYSGGVATFTDISLRKRLEDDLRRLAQIPGENPAPVLRLALDQTVLYANSAAQRLLDAFATIADDSFMTTLQTLVGKAASRDAHIEAEFTDTHGRLYTITAIRPAGEDYVNCYAYDITDRQRAEEALRVSEARYRTLFNSMTEGFALCALLLDDAGEPVDFRYLDINPAFEHLTGLTRDAVVGHTLHELLPGEDPRWLEEYARVALTGQPVQFAHYSSSLQRHYQVYAYSPAPEQFAAIFIDITEQIDHEAERAQLLVEAQRRSAELDAVFNALPFLVSVHDREGRYLRVNPSIVSLFGFDPTTTLREETARRLRARFPDGVPFTAANIPSNRAFHGEIVREVPYLITSGDGETHRLLITAIPLSADGEVYGAVFAQIDITAHEHLVSELQRRVAELDTILDTLADGVMIFDTESRMIRCNAAAESLLPFSPAERARPAAERLRLIGLERQDGTPVTYDISPVGRALQRGETTPGEIMMAHVGERRLWVSTTAAPLRAPDGGIIGAVVTQGDITTLHQLLEQREQLRSEVQRQTLALALSESETRYRQLFETITSGVTIYTYDAETNRFLFKERNAMAERISDMPTDQVVGRAIDEVLPGIGATGLLEKFHAAWRTGMPQHHPVTEYTYGRLTLWIENHIYKLSSGEIVAVFDDITPRMKAEEALTHSREQLRRLALRLAELEEHERQELAHTLHDLVGQNLSVLGMMLCAIRDGLSPASHARLDGHFADALRLVEEVTVQLRTVMLELRPSMLDDYGLHAALKWACGNFATRTGITIEFDGLPEAHRLPATVETALYRIALEALTNVAKHAHAATVFVTLETAPLVRLSIVDDGVGFAAAHPAVREQAGWGLMIMQERARAIGGEVHIDAQPGQGTRVLVVVEEQTHA